jgi:chromosome partitioning protein
MQRIVVLNPKGGSGKTTIAINLAGYYALRGEHPTVMDYDPQASATQWVRKRRPGQANIHLISAAERDNRVTRAYQLRIPQGSSRVIVDTPAGLDAHAMPELAAQADKILVPVLPSDIDFHACSRCISNLLLVAKVRRSENRLAIIANRVRRNTLVYAALTRFLDTLHIPIVTTLRDSQNYLRGADQGLCLHEMKPYQVSEDLETWAPLLAWLDEPSKRPVVPAGADLVRPVLVVRPGVQVAGDGGMATACTLHVLKPARVRLGTAFRPGSAAGVAFATVRPRWRIELTHVRSPFIFVAG